MKKPQKRRIHKNYALRQELIEKGFITPVHMVPQRARERGFTIAADVAEERLRNRLPLYRR
jgi:predicted amidophosphoribosyltransferase